LTIDSAIPLPNSAEHEQRAHTFDVQTSRMDDVLVIDDDYENRAVIVELLTDAGYAVRASPDAETGMRTIIESPPALLLLDIQLPGAHGDALVRMLSTTDYTFPIVLITALQLTAELLKAMGGVAYVAKPFHIDELLACVARYVQPQHARAAGSDELGEHSSG